MEATPEKILCENTQGSIILTTQKSNFPKVTDVFKSIGITSFGREQGSSLLSKYLGDEPCDDEVQTAAEEISHLVGGLPLAIATIGGYISQSECRFSDFLAQMRSSFKA